VGAAEFLAVDDSALMVDVVCVCSACRRGGKQSVGFVAVRPLCSAELLAQQTP
jgi:hypothetical protein